MNTPQEKILKEKEKNIVLEQENIQKKKEIIGLKKKIIKKPIEMTLSISPLILGLASFIISIFFLTERLTGYVTFNLDKTSVNYIGLTFFTIALISLLYYFWKQRHMLDNQKSLS